MALLGKLFYEFSFARGLVVVNQHHLEVEARLRELLKAYAWEIIDFYLPRNPVSDALDEVHEIEKLDPVNSNDWSFGIWLRFVEAMQRHLSETQRTNDEGAFDHGNVVDEARIILAKMQEEINIELLLGSIYLGGRS